MKLGIEKGTNRDSEMATQCKFDGTLSSDEFQIAAEALVARWEETNRTQPQWSWICSPKPPPSATHTMGGYLSLENVYFFKESRDCTSEQEEISDDTTLVLDENQHMHVYEFHILYNFSYRVPVLYFRGYKYGGQPLDLRHIEEDLPLYSSMILKESKWTYITQEEHPFLQRPWYMLHPCGTSEWMNLLLGGLESEVREIKQYVVSWLSVVGQAVGLRIPLEIQSSFPLVKSASCVI